MNQAKNIIRFRYADTAGLCCRQISKFMSRCKRQHACVSGTFDSSGEKALMFTASPRFAPGFDLESI